ncbi:hypothetical protein PF010_g18797 [Phytophthora fragariae]|uniref:Uncharacterized protein n=2 Tax=Phytophthora fragariae TaxID=53985 RepID=A0A6A3T152_9STRA|nr:hypothetical protein PF011_g17658 [Phytophthora fragariae]KAE9089919.1 hypothetical protein PF010_g18797 [Phytophthora fragariae]KAE9127705.1 hypothetical protein PF006_g16460 [Phytophthora fragariae]
MASCEALGQRWGFLAPWCRVLEHRISYSWPTFDEEVWDCPNRRLEVELPTRYDKNSGGDWVYKGYKEFMATFDKVREALALLAAVAHVDQLAWKYLLQNHCHVELGGGGERNFPLEDIPARFILIILENQGQPKKTYPVSLEGDLVHLCGVRQRTHTSRSYQVALEKIAALDKNLKSGKPGVDVKIPVRMRFHIDEAKEMSPEPLELIQRAEELNRLHWAKVALDENVILQSCPKLEELAICENFVDVRLTFSEYQANGEPLPLLNCHWNDVIALSADMSDENNPLAKCVRRLRVRLMNRAHSWGAINYVYDALNFDQHVHSLPQMLEVNRNVEYLDVVVADLQEYAEDFKKHNHQPTNRSIKLAMESKTAFLSVLAFGNSQSSKWHKPSQSQSTLPQLDQLIVSNIFVLAATPIFRAVHFRRPGDDSDLEERFQLHI